MFKNFALVAMGGALGSMIRYGTYLIVGPRHFPFSTLIINIIGSFIIGAVIGIGIKYTNFPEGTKLFLAVGICGGFTTFSSFSIENVNLLQNGKYFLCLAYILSSILLGMFAAWGGYETGLRT